VITNGPSLLDYTWTHNPRCAACFTPLLSMCLEYNRYAFLCVIEQGISLCRCDAIWCVSRGGIGIATSTLARD